MAWAPSNFQGKQEQRKVFQTASTLRLGAPGIREAGHLPRSRRVQGLVGPPRLSCFPRQRVREPREPREPPPGHRSPRREPASMRNVVPKPARLVGESPSPGLSLLTSLVAVLGHLWKTKFAYVGQKLGAPSPVALATGKRRREGRWEMKC